MDRTVGGDRYAWARVGWNTDDNAVVAVRAVSLAIELTTAGQFSTISLVVTIPNSNWNPGNFYDGLMIPGNEAARLLEFMAADTRNWCELSSPDIRLHLTEDDSVYAGKTSGMDQLVEALSGGLSVGRVAISPYSSILEGQLDVDRYPSDSDEFWTQIAHLLMSGEPFLGILVVWAGGWGGELWYVVRTREDLAAVRKGVPPRSVIAVFTRDHFSVFSDCSLEKIIEVDLTLFSTRWLVPISDSAMQKSVMFDDAQDLVNLCLRPDAGALIFCWPMRCPTICSPVGRIRTE